jgi:Taurine catabolism dioxygenase TauD, TfdA family
MHHIKRVQNVATFLRRQPKYISLNLDFQGIQKNGYQLVRGFGTDVERLTRDLNIISGGKLFFSERLGGVLHQFSVLPYSHNLSEQASCGGYHTDFMFQPHPPEFIALLCIKPDPKYPFYGRNQIVHYDAFIQKMHTVYGVSELDLLELKVNYVFPNYSTIEVPIIQKYGDRNIFRLHTTLMGAASTQKLLIDTPLKDALDAICGDVAQDIVLDQGDILIVSNHVALHRRSECSLSFNSDGSSFESRKMATIRFDR